MKLTTKEITLVAIIPALMGATAIISIPLGQLPDITLQTLFVAIAGLLLRKELAFLSMIIYIILGLIGLPVFSLGTSGLGVILGATGGFILGFPVAAYLISLLKDIKIMNNQFVSLLLILIGVNLILYLMGGLYFKFITGWNLSSTVALFGLYIPGDILKITAAIYIYIGINSYLELETNEAI